LAGGHERLAISCRLLVLWLVVCGPVLVLVLLVARPLGVVVLVRGVGLEGCINWAHASSGGGGGGTDWVLACRHRIIKGKHKWLGRWISLIKVVVVVVVGNYLSGGADWVFAVCIALV
jgi:hypothetical protein